MRPSANTLSKGKPAACSRPKLSACAPTEGPNTKGEARSGPDPPVLYTSGREWGPDGFWPRKKAHLYKAVTEAMLKPSLVRRSLNHGG